MKLIPLFICLFSVVVLWANQPPRSGKRPNVVIFLADDLGYGDLSSYGGIPQTPNLDQLAKEGARFTNFYAAAPNCSPSRAALMTGRAPFRSGLYSYRPTGHTMHLRKEEITIAEQLKGAGYQTVHLGKWHLGELPATKGLNHPQPDDHGFDYSYGTENGARPSHHNPINYVRNGEKLKRQDGYSCQLLANEAIHWCDDVRDDSRPFFMYVAFHEPHSVVAAPKRIVDKYRSSGRAATYMACIENMDNAVGRILKKLDDMNVRENTLVIFASDNGSYRLASNGGLRAIKSWLYDGGIRVPGIISWKSEVASGQIIDEPAGLVDLFSTISHATDVAPPKKLDMDGTNLLPLLKGKRFVRRQPLFWFYYRTSPELAIRRGNEMIMGKDRDTTARTYAFSDVDMEYIRTMRIRDVERYDLSKDRAQQSNLSAEKGNLKELNKLLDEIQEKGVKWDTIPHYTTKRRIKTNWKKYK